MANADVLSHTISHRAEVELSLTRLYTLRLCYLMLAVGLGLVIWPTVLHHTAEVALRSGARLSLLAGLGAAALLGLRYPVQMLPLLLFELLWKIIFLVAFALPLWSAHQLTPAAAANIQDCLTVVLFIPLIPLALRLRPICSKARPALALNTGDSLERQPPACETTIAACFRLSARMFCLPFLYHHRMPPRPTRTHIRILRAVLEIAFILVLFYSNLLMGEFDRSSPHRSLSAAIHDCVTPHNFLIGLLAATAGFLVFEMLRNRL